MKTTVYLHEIDVPLKRKYVFLEIIIEIITSYRYKTK